MPISLAIPAPVLFGFLLVLARVAGALVFVPLPGIKAAAEPVRAALAIAFTMALFPRWPSLATTSFTLTSTAGWILAEAAIGIAIGLCVAVLLESFALAAQMCGLQAGYSYASTIDPNTEADSGVLLVFAQLIAGMLFFSLGLDRELLRLFAWSLERVPAGAYPFGAHSAEGMIRLAGGLFAVGVRLSMPVVALLVMVDVALALLGRLNQQLQLLSLAFPAKMLIALLLMSWMASLYPRLLLAFAGQAWTVMRRVLEG